MVTSLAMTLDRLEIEAGGSATAELTIRNSGSIVDEFRCTVLGEAADWSVIEPEAVTLLPGGERTVAVTITPPRSPAVLAGPRDFAVRVRPREQPADTIVEEVGIEILPFTEVSGELLPHTAVARRWGETQVALDNRGNHPVEVVLVPGDPDQLVEFRIAPDPVWVEPGEAAFALLRLRARRRHLAGRPRTYPIGVLAEPSDGEVFELGGAVQQQARIPQWLVRALLISGLGLIALLILWFALLKPTLESTARDAVEREVSAAQDAAQTAGDAAGAANEAAGAAAAAAAGPEEEGAGGEEAGAEGEATEEDDAARAQAAAAADAATQVRPGIDGDPFDFRLVAVAGPGSSGTQAFTVPDEQILSLTDIVLQNPQADAGRIQIRRGSAVLLEARLENFRDLDYHFVAPIVYTGGQQVGLLVACERDDGATCQAAGYFAGFLTPPPPTEEPTPAPTG